MRDNVVAAVRRRLRHTAAGTAKPPASEGLPYLTAITGGFFMDELEQQGLVVLAGKGYQGSAWAKVPYNGKNKPEPQKEANRAHAKLLTWNILSKLRCCPGAPGISPRPSTYCSFAKPNQAGKAP